MLFLVTFSLLPILTYSRVVHMNLPDFNRNISANETYLHLKHAKIIQICDSREDICRSNSTVVCTVRDINGGKVFQEYNNSCYLFISNMCEYPGEEFFIVSGTRCSEYLKSRRHGLIGRSNEDKTKEKKKITTTTQPTTMSTLYDIDTAFDFHICPLSCPDTYSPVCVCVNRGFGQYFKFYTFVNHCEADRYYCMHWQEFSPPPDEDEKIQSSNLGWSYCGSSRYLQFTRFAEAASSLGHYGWLQGESRYSHILEPHERLPGYG